jgi:outer membrane receptor protein involved in Fe transport
LQVKYDLDPGPGVVVNPYVRAQTQFYNLATLQFGGVQGAAGEAGLNNRTFVMNVRTTQVGNRFGDIETNAFGMHGGLKGTIPSIDWDWEVYQSYARNTTTVKNNNNIGLTAMTQLLNACNTTSTAAQPQPIGVLPNCPFPTRTGAGPAAFVPTTTTNNPLGVFALSQDMINFVRVNSTDVINYEQTVISANATGDVIDLWGEGAIGAAIGFEYRSEELDNRVDPFKNAGDIIGFNAAKSIAGQFDVYEIYGEVNVPLITGETLFENLSLVGGYRKSDYSTGAAITETWKYGAEWAPFDWLNFRAVANHAVRAPSAFELFRNGDQNFPAYVDPCNTVGQTLNNAGCTAWFAAFGGTVYPVGAFAQPNTQTQAFLFGNPGLEPEIADTLTYGVVFNPEWWPVGRLGVSVDRYEIDYDNQIGQRSITQIMNGCRDAIIANGNAYPVGNQFCDAITRDPLSSAPGAVGAINQSLTNFAGVSTYSGIDVNLKWSWDMEDDIGLPGTFGVTSLYTWVDDAAGAQGFFVGSIGGIIPENKAASTFTYDLDDWSFLVRWTYLGGVEDGVFGTFNTPQCAAGPSAACGASGGFYQTPLDSYNMYDIGGRWNMTDDLQFSFGIDNVFDKQPPLWAGAIGNGQFNTDGSSYEQLGRQYRLGLRWKH